MAMQKPCERDCEKHRNLPFDYRHRLASETRLQEPALLLGLLRNSADARNEAEKFYPARWIGPR